MRLAAIVLSAVALCGCVSQSASIHSLPAENPAAQNAAAAESAAAFAAAATAGGGEGGGEGGPEHAQTPAEAGAAVPATATASEPGAAANEVLPPVTPEDAPSMQTYDPWERVNRFTYRFNARFDEALFLPVANGYRRIPSPLRSGVHNFFGNLSEVSSVINYTLQGRLKLGLRSLARFAINSTVGIGGLIDVAKKIRLPGAPTGWGTTLAKWGMHPGPYLVIPLLGPSTLRDGLGFLGDYGTSYGVDVARLYRGDASWGLATLNAVDQRSNVSFRYYASGSAFEYENIRFLYVRKTLIEDDALRARGAKRGGAAEPKEHNPQVPAGK